MWNKIILWWWIWKENKRILMKNISNILLETFEMIGWMIWEILRFGEFYVWEMWWIWREFYEFYENRNIWWNELNDGIWKTQENYLIFVRFDVNFEREFNFDVIYVKEKWKWWN